MKHLLQTTIAAVVLVGCGEVPKDIGGAAEKGDIKAVQQFIAAGSDVNAKNDYGVTPLHYAAIGHKEIAELLISKGADVNAKDNWGRTPLIYAGVKGHKEIVELLLANGANVNAKNDDGVAPLFDSVAIGHKEITELLISKGADVNAIIVSSRNQGKTPLDLAIEFEEIETADLLRKHGGKTGEELKAEGK